MMINCYLKYKLCLSIVTPQNPKDWTSPLLNTIGTKIIEQTAEIILLEKEHVIVADIPIKLVAEPEQCAYVHI